jgi:hypothetical protein
MWLAQSLATGLSSLRLCLAPSAVEHFWFLKLALPSAAICQPFFVFPANLAKPNIHSTPEAQTTVNYLA